MKIINIFWISILLIPYANAGFTETELYQLQEINEKYIKKAEDSKALLDKKFKRQLKISQSRKVR